MTVGGGTRRRRGKVRALVLLGKKFVAFLFSHVGLCALMIAYTMLGSVLFRAIEGPHERDTHKYVRGSRSKAVGGMWHATYKYNAKLDKWASNVSMELHEFKAALLRIIQKGYDANDQEDNTQWTFSGAFLYSLTVITTIGYGNIACRTAFGKAMTIVYAILGIPLMLLFLTNIGDVLAKVFKFLYRKTVRLKIRAELWNKKRKVRQIRRANVGSVAPAPKTPHQLQLQTAALQQSRQRLLSSPLLQPARDSPRRQKKSVAAAKLSMETRLIGAGAGAQTSSHIFHRASTSSTGSFKGAKTKGPSPTLLRANHQSTAASQRGLPPLALAPSPTPIAEDVGFEEIRSETLVQRYESDEMSSTDERLNKVSVPLWLVLCTMLAYLIGGAVLFTVWEKWSFFNSFYFCYVSLATIGFGDLFPGTSLKDAGSAQEKLIITSLYLLLGMALIAMCFNLAQEEVVNKMTRVAGKLGIIQASDPDVSVYEPD